MYGRALFFVVLVVVGAVLPYLLADEKWLGKVENWFSKPGEVNVASPSDVVPPKVTTAGKAIASKAGFDPALSSRKSDAYAGSLPVDQASYAASPIGITANYAVQSAPQQSSLPNASLPGGDIPLPHVLSFETTPEWITSNWDRVTTRIGELDLQGWRVAYARRVDDFAGSVTYYFDRTRTVQRIVLHGYTSDASEYVQLAQSHYQMRRAPNPKFDLFLATVSGRPLGGMRVTYAPVLDSRAGGKRSNILMELNRNGTEYGMSYEFNKLIGDVRSANELLTPIQPNPFRESPFRTNPLGRPSNLVPRG